MRRKRSQSPLTPGGAMSPHRTTRASSRSPRTPGSKAILTPTSESPKSTKCELNGHISTHLRPRQTSNSPNKLSPHDVNSLKDTSNSYRRSSRVNRGLDYHKSESEDNDNEGHNSEHETRTRSLRKDRSKRENLESRTSSCKRARREERSTHDHSFVTSDEDDETGGRESPFLNHVRFSPSAKMGSPARSRDLRQLTPASKNNITSRRSSRAAADVARIRLQNVPSEDEQFEFNRRYSRDLRQRKGAARKHFSDVDGKRGDDNAISPTRTTRMSPRRAQGRTSPMPTADLRSRRGRHSTLNAETKNASEEDIHNASKDTNKELEDAGEADDESQQSDEDCKESRRSTRTKLARELSGEDETKKCPSSASPIRRSSRRRGSVDYVSKRNRNPSMTEDEEKAEKDDEDTPIRRSRRTDRKSDQRDENDSTNWVRRSSRQTKSTASDGNEAELEGCLSDGTHHSPENGVRRSKREHHKPSFYDPVAYEKQQSSSDDEDEEEDEEEEEDDDDDDEEEDKPIHRSQRRKSKRRRRSVERFAYEPSEPIRKRSGREHRRSQFSSDEEFQRGRGESNRSRRRSSQRRRPTNMNRMRDTSSSSSEDEMEKRDEASFQKRKTKRMNIERSKLLPLNFGKSDAAQSIFRERSKAGASLADISPMEIDMNVTFESIGGLDEHVDKLREMIMFPLLYGEFFKKYNTNPPKGVLFYGPPGTGKTMMARALACECSQENRKVAFFMRKGADCLSKWIGESERQLRLLFDQAYQMRPSIIFFDEIDGLAPVRSSRQDQIHSSIVSTLLALMDGLDDRGEVIIIGATNRIENIDPALRRPGRFDRELRFALPTQAARNDILALSMKKWTPPISSDLINLLSEKTIGYCGADLKGLCAEAPLNALRRRYPHVYKTNQKLALNLDEIIVTEDDFFKAMKSIVPSTHRIQDQYQCPLPPEIRPLLQATVVSICQIIEKIMPKRQYGSSSNEQLGSYYRPRLLIKGNPKQGLTTYIGPAILHAFETLPCHKLDITSLFSNAARSPEEALFHVIHEARKTIPSILYIPHFMKLWSNVMTGIHATLKEALISLLSDIPPSAPLLILAIAEYADIDENSDSCTALNLFNQADQVLTMQNPSEEERKTYFKPIFEAARRPPPQIEETTNVHVNEALRIVPVADTRKLTEKEEKRLRRKEDALMRELRIFLRDIHQKINKEPKFFMFRVPVDTEEVYDYLDVVKKPMDFDQMQTKLDNHEYSCAKDFLDDIDLVAENAIKYNGDPNYETNKVICHRARALQDFAYALVKAEMDTDFEDNCKEIVSRRKTLTGKLKKTDKDEDKFFSMAEAQEPTDDLNASLQNSQRKRKPKRRVSKWQRGYTPKPKKIKDKNDKEEPIETTDSHKEKGENVSADEQEEQENEGHAEETTDAMCDYEDEDSRLSASNMDTSSQSVHETNHILHIDEEQLNGIEKDLLRVTHEFPLESLERLYCQMIDCVLKFKHRYERSDLIQMLQSRLPSEPRKIIEGRTTSPNRKGGRV